MKQFLLTLGLLTPVLCYSQYSIPWYKISSGGGTSSNAPYSLTGTIGQPDASGTMSGGGFSVTGGFWSLLAAVQVPGAPALTLTVTGPGTALVSWSSSFPGWTLQENSVLGSPNWTTVTNNVSVVGGQIEVNVSTKPGNNFFRLSRPQ
jgi:hypothetical protein